MSKKESVIINKEQSLGKDEWYGEWFNCPRCNNKNIRIHVKYCDNCGAKIKWVSLDRGE